MLKGISPVVSPELIKTLMEMGHGDEICIGDGNFPAASMAKRLVRLDGHGVTEVLDAILSLMPLDRYVESPVALMQVTPGDDVVPVIWDEYQKVINAREGGASIVRMERFAFYERAKCCYAVVATGERALYANIIIKKGVVK